MFTEGSSCQGWPWWLTRVRECGTEEGERGAAGGQLFTGAKSGRAGTAGLGAALQWWGILALGLHPGAWHSQPWGPGESQGSGLSRHASVQAR